MVLLAVNPKTFDPACCKAEVLKGGYGLVSLFDFWIEETENVSSLKSSSSFLAPDLSAISIFFCCF
jgi:hypothetical protein